MARPSILILAALLGGCDSYATRTRSTQAGGSYVLTFATAREETVHSTVRDVIYDVQAQCHGADYEITSIATVPGDPGVYLGPDDQPVQGPYRTVISYECHEPRKTDLNHRLYALAGPSVRPVSSIGNPENTFQEPSTECVETWDCPRGQICEARPCGDAAKNK
jgi:hypothetical protein